MSQFTYRANLSSKAFPFISDNWGRTVIVPQYDNTFNREVSSDADEDRDAGIPQAYYMHNVMPTAQGWQSIGYNNVLSAAADGTIDFALEFLLRDASGTKIYLGVTTSKKFYVNDGTGWVYKTTIAYTGDVTTAFVNGITYIYCGQVGCYKYDFATAAFVSVTLTALDSTKVAGITGAVGYLLAWQIPVSAVALTLTTSIGSPTLLGAVTTGVVVNQEVTGTGIPVGSYVVSINPGVSITINQSATAAGAVTVSFLSMPSAIAWSSTIDPTDFAPSLVTGAGGGNVEGARGSITYCIAHTLGFIAYTTNNAVSAVYSNNARYPFVFREILSSGGLSNQNYVSYDANTGNHYAYTTSGLQLISTASSQTIFPDLTDFISGRLFEDYDESTESFVRTVLSAQMQKQLNVVADRYLIISYGITSLTHALIWDISQKRWGKFKIPHVAVFEYQLPAVVITEIPRQSIAFMQADGAVKLVDFAPYSASSSGVIALGKYQFVRARNLILDEIMIENIYDISTFEITVRTSLDGKNMTDSEPTLNYSNGLFAQYGTLVEGVNHSLLIEGNFQLESLVLRFHLGGKR